MPFSSQPQKKKGTQASQAGSRLPACGHATPKSGCAICQKEKGAQIIDLPTEKKKISVLVDKIVDRLTKDPKATQKAAFIISNWINKVRK